MRNTLVLAAAVSVLMTALPAPAESPARPTVRLWLEGNAGPPGPANPFDATAAPLRRELLAFLNRSPATAAEVAAAFPEMSSPAHELASLAAAALVSPVERADGATAYRPTIAILTADDLAILSPRMLAASNAYAAFFESRLQRLDRVLEASGLTPAHRLPVFMAFVRDACFFQLMDREGLFPTTRAACPVNGDGNVYGSEPYAALDTLGPFMLSHARTDSYSFVFLYPFFKDRSRFNAWGYAFEFTAKPEMARLLDACLEKPCSRPALDAVLADTQAAAHAGEMAAELESAGALERRGDGWLNVAPVLSEEALGEQCGLAEEAAEPIVEMVTGLDGVYPRTAAAQNGVSLAELREAVAWRTIWTTVGLLVQRGVFPSPDDDGPGLTVYRRPAGS